jgi:hypothetical protein
VINKKHTKSTYRCCILAIEVSYQRHISTSYQWCISTIEAPYQRCISATSLRYWSGQSHLRNIFKGITFMLDIFKCSYIINEIKEYHLLGFFSLYRVSQGICVVDVHAYLST